MIKGIRQRILTTYLSLTLVAIVLLAFILIYQGRGFLADNARDALLESSQLRAQIVELRIQQEINKLKYLSSTSTAKALNGNEILSLLRGMVSDTENQLLVNALYAKPDGSILSLFNETGSISNQPYFSKLIRDNLDYTISDPMTAQADAPPLVVILAAIRDSQGNITGVLGSAIDLGKLSNSLTDASTHETTYSWIVDDTGAAIAYPSSEFLSKIGFPDSVKPSFTGSDVIGQANLALVSGTFEYTDKGDGRSKVGAYSTIPGTDGWKLCTAMSKQEVNAPLFAMSGLLAAASVLLAGLLFLASGWLSQNLVTPIVQIAHSAENLERGTLVPVDEPQEPEEINHLVRSFNHMANALSLNTAELEKTIEENNRTLKEINGRIHDRNSRMSQINGGFLDVATRDKDTHLLTRNEVLKQLELIKTEVDTEVTESFSLLLMGLDNFNFYLETFGPEAGNLIVQKTARMISSTIRSTDIAARYDQNTFMIILSGTNQVRADSVILKLTQAFQEQTGLHDDLRRLNESYAFPVPKESRLELSVSVVVYTKKMGLPAEMLVKQAESAMSEVRKEHQKQNADRLLHI